VGRITDEDIARVRDATDIVKLISERMVLKPKGRLFWGLCPFHGEKTPSFKVDPSTQLYHCFGCGEGGDVFRFLMRTENMEFPEAVRLLAERANIELAEAEGGVPRGHKERLYAALSEAAEYYHRVLTGSRETGAGSARDYLAGRGFGSAVAKSWRLGFAPGRGALVKHLTAAGFSADEMVDANLALRADNGVLKDRFYERIMFPIDDMTGRTIAFGGRTIGGGEPKYLNTNDTPVFHKSATLYALDRAKATIVSTGTAIVVEGYTDVIALHEAGITNVVATLGTAHNRRHVKLLARFAKRIVYLFDGDAAGLAAAEKAAGLIDDETMSVDLNVAVIPDSLDPADLVARDGAAAMTAVVEGSRPLLEFAIERRLDRWDLERPEQRSRAVKDAAEVLAPLRGSTIASDYANLIADRLFVKVEQVIAAIPSKTATAHEPEPQALPEDGPMTLFAPTGKEGKAERELIALMVTHARLRPQAQELLTQSLLAEPAHRALAEIIASADSGMSVAALVGMLESGVPGAAHALSGVDSGTLSQDEAEIMASDLVTRLKGFALERRIAAGRARLKRPESFKDSAESDDLFREVSELQRELDALRRGAATTE
jgi:DNA primase